MREFVDSLSGRSQHKYFVVIELLQAYGKSLTMPHLKHLGKGMYELRFTGQEGQVRVLMFFIDGQKIILTNAFIKKSPKTPRQEIELCLSRRVNYLKRKRLEER